MARKVHVRQAILSAAVLGIAIASPHAWASDSPIQWVGDAGTGSWDDPTNWAAGVLPNETRRVEFLPSTGNDPLTISLGQDRIIDGLIISRLTPFTLGSPADVSAGVSLTLRSGTLVNHQSGDSPVVACNLILGADGVISGGNVTVSGAISDAGRGYGLTIAQSSNFTSLLAANTYSGPTQVQSGALRLASSNGSLLSTSAITVQSPSIAWAYPTLLIDNTAGNNDNRIPDQTPITLQQRSQLTYLGQPAGNSTETFGDLVLDGSNATITLTPGLDGTANLISSALVRTNGGAVRILAQNLGTGASANASSLKFKTAPTLVGGGDPAGSPTVSIIPFLTVTTSSDNTIGELATYDSGRDGVAGTPDDRGVRMLDATEYASYASAGPNDNVRIAEPLTDVQGKIVNSLSLSSGPNGYATSLSGTGTLVINSGVILGSSRGASISGFSNLYFNNREAILGSVTITSPISYANGLTAVGDVILLGGRHRYTGTTRVLGSLEIDSPYALGDSGGDGVVLNSGSLYVLKSMVLSRPFTIAPGSSRIAIESGRELTFLSPIHASGNLSLSAGIENSNTTAGVFKFKNDATFAQQLDISDAGDVTFAGKASFQSIKMWPVRPKRSTLTLSGTSFIERLDAYGPVEILISGDTEIGRGGLNASSFEDSILKITGKITGTGGINLRSFGDQRGTLISPRSQPSLNSVFLTDMTALLGADSSLGTGYLNIDASTMKNTDSASHTYTHKRIIMNNATLGGVGSADMVFTSTVPAELGGNITIDNNGLTPVTVTYSGPLQSSSFTKLGSGTLVLTGSERNEMASVVVKEGTLVLNKPAGIPALGSPSILEVADAGRVVWQSNEQLVANSYAGWHLCDSGLLDLNGHAEKQATIRFASSLQTTSSTGAGSITTGAQGKLTMVSESHFYPEALIAVHPSATATARISGNLELAAPTTFEIWNGSQPIDLLIDAALTGSGDLKKTGTGVLQLTGPNTSTGKT
ncbi:MAG: hypothetical protein ACM359_24405, partial [Bacillota bacterium]